MKQLFTLSLLFSLLATSPVIGQTTLLTGNLVVRYSSSNPTGDSATMGYNSNFQLDERVNLELDTNGNWNLKSRLIDHTYDPEGHILSYRKQVVDGANVWVNSARYTYTYNGDGNELSYFAEKWDTAVGWVNFQRKISTYNPDGKQLSYIQEKWNGTNWVNLQSPTYWVYDANGNVESITQGNFRSLRTYNAQNLLETIISQEKNGGWIDKRLIEYTYVPNDTKVATETGYYQLNNVWVGDIRYSDTYDGNENLIEHLSEQWNGSSWVNNSLQTHLFNAEGYVIEDLGYEWMDTAWTNRYLNLYSYDAENNPIYYISKQWVSGFWENSLQQFSGFDANSNFINARTEIWDGISWNLWLIGRDHYTEFVSTEAPELVTFEIFPNPASISVTLKGEGFNFAMIYDQHGRVVRSQRLQGQDQETLHVGNLPAGNYFIQVLGKDGKTETKPLQVRR